MGRFFILAMTTSPAFTSLDESPVFVSLDGKPSIYLA